MAHPSVEWTKILIHPLGLAGYALCLLFGLLARAKRRVERRWILPSALVAAGVALLGGIALAHREGEVHPQQPATISSVPSHLHQQNDHPQLNSTGGNSPNIQGTQGDVNVTYSGIPQMREPEQRQKPEKIQKEQAK